VSRRKRNGYTLIEILIVVAIIGLTLAVTIPNFSALRRRMALRAAAGELRSAFHLVRMRAIARGVNTGMKFVMQDGVWHFATYEDGDATAFATTTSRKALTSRRAAAHRLLAIADRHHRPSRLQFKDADGDSVKSPVTFNQTTLCCSRRPAPRHPARATPRTRR
jgi:prepilin-type N-terminal cleavage/methylation domain-containing protein